MSSFWRCDFCGLGAELIDETRPPGWQVINSGYLSWDVCPDCQVRVDAAVTRAIREMETPASHADTSFLLSELGDGKRLRRPSISFLPLFLICLIALMFTPIPNSIRIPLGLMGTAAWVVAFLTEGYLLRKRVDDPCS